MNVNGVVSSAVECFVVRVHSYRLVVQPAFGQVGGLQCGIGGGFLRAGAFDAQRSANGRDPVSGMGMEARGGNYMCLFGV